MNAKAPFLRSSCALVIAAGLAAPAFGQYRSMDGSGNNAAHPTWGQAGGDLMRLTAPAYADGFSAMSRPLGPNPRDVSNAVVAQSGSILNNRNMSDLVWQWGQFIDHDLDLSLDGSEAANISTSPTDPYFLGAPIFFNRSEFDPATGTTNPRQHLNVNSSYIDGSMIYGSDQARSDALRAHSGGRLLSTPSPTGALLPYNTMGLPNVTGPGNASDYFVAGDLRANEQTGLTSMHTLWMREHNRWADTIAADHPTWTDDQVFKEARMVVGAEVQKITYQDWLPTLLGPGRIAPYAGYNASVNSTVATEFSSAAFRIGHTLLSPMLQRLDNNGNSIPQGPLPLRDAFFNPAVIPGAGGISPVLKGLASQAAQEIDRFVVDDVRNFLFGPPGAGGFDLASLNIQRGRDHGLADYNTIRVAMGLPAVINFAGISSDPATQAALASVYPDVNSIDPWVGMISEDHLPGGSVGPLMTAIIADQFTRCRDGDWYFYQSDPGMLPYLSTIDGTTLGDIIRANTDITSLQGNVFLVPAPASGVVFAGLLVVCGRRRRAAAR